VLDIACGEAELLRRICARYGARGVGVDISPYEVADARRKNVERGLDRRMDITEGGSAEYVAEPESFDLAMCIGATWVWPGFAGTLEALKRLTKPGGLIAVGEPFKLKEPEPGYIEAEGDFAAGLVTHYDNCRAGEAAGLTYLYSMVSSRDDWDRYVGHTNRAAELYAIEQPEDPDVPEMLERTRRDTDAYLRWGRETAGWAVYLFCRP
jgi:SAM-dependent methyltransferase